MRKTDDRFRAVGTDALMDTDLIFAVCLNDTDSFRRNLNRVLCAVFPDCECLGSRDRGEINAADQLTLIDDFSKVLAVALLAEKHPDGEKTGTEECEGERDKNIYFLSQEITRTFPPEVIVQRSASPEVTRTSPLSVIMMASN